MIREGTVPKSPLPSGAGPGWATSLNTMFDSHNGQYKVVSRARLFGSGLGLKLTKFWAEFGPETCFCLRCTKM